jgi:hypothetical protein
MVRRKWFDVSAGGCAAIRAGRVWLFRAGGVSVLLSQLERNTPCQTLTR